jgi:hypothetical protein
MLKKVGCFGFISYLCTQKCMFNDKLKIREL